MSEQKTENETAGGQSELSGLVILPSEISMESWPPSPRTGMTTGTISNGVLIHHKPSGVMVTCDKHRSQHANRVEAIKKLKTIVAALAAI